MDKYLVSSNSSTSAQKTDIGDGGLLELLTNARKNESSTYAAGWREREQQTLSVVDILCDHNSREAASRNFVGWKTTSDGKKVYTTFRSGHKVAAEGHEGFKLAKGDEAAKRKKSSSRCQDPSAKTCTALEMPRRVQPEAASQTSGQKEKTKKRPIIDLSSSQTTEDRVTKISRTAPAPTKTRAVPSSTAANQPPAVVSSTNVEDCYSF
jgi:hypothetical protein